MGNNNSRSCVVVDSKDVYPVTQGFVDVVLERQRQINLEVWTLEYDDDNLLGEELSHAAICYISAEPPCFEPPDEWPFSITTWEPRNHRGNLVKAAALILAEIERLDYLVDRTLDRQ